MSVKSIGVVGAGVFGSYHASKVSELAQTCLSGVYDIDTERAAKLAEKHGAPVQRNIDALIENSDAIIVTTPASTHFEHSQMALNAGCHVFIEKPISPSLGEARSLVKLAQERGLIIQVGHQERYVCEALGLFGRDKTPNRIECIRHVPYSDRCADVSAVMDLMVHDLDIARKLASSDILNVSATGGHHGVAAELFLENGLLACFSARRHSDQSERRMTIVYDDGVVDFDFIRREVRNTTPTTLLDLTASPDAPLALRDPLGHGALLFRQSIENATDFGVTGVEATETIAWARKIEHAAGLNSTDAIGDKVVTIV